MTTTSTVTPTNFSVSLINQLNADKSNPQIPINNTTVGLLNAWQLGGENQWGASGIFGSATQHNPLNIETDPSGDTPTTCGQTIGAVTLLCDSKGNKTLSYATWQDGVEATAAFIEKNQPQIIGALATPTTGNNTAASDYNETLSNFINEVNAGGWASNPGYASQILTYFTEHNLGSQGAVTPLGIAGFLPIPNSLAYGLTVNPSTSMQGTANPSSDCLINIGVLGGCILSRNMAFRIGLGALGIALCLIGILLIFKNDAKDIAPLAGMVAAA